MFGEKGREGRARAGGGGGGGGWREKEGFEEKQNPLSEVARKAPLSPPRADAGFEKGCLVKIKIIIILIREATTAAMGEYPSVSYQRPWTVHLVPPIALLSDWGGELGKHWKVLLLPQNCGGVQSLGCCV